MIAVVDSVEDADARFEEGVDRGLSVYIKVVEIACDGEGQSGVARGVPRYSVALAELDNLPPCALSYFCILLLHSTS